MYLRNKRMSSQCRIHGQTDKQENYIHICICLELQSHKYDTNLIILNYLGESDFPNGYYILCVTLCWYYATDY